MAQCIQCGVNLIGTPENPPVDSLCKYCQIENLHKEVKHLKAEVEHYRKSNHTQGKFRTELAEKLEHAEKSISILAYSLRQLLRASHYVLRHKFGENDPVGTRLLAIQDLRQFAEQAERKYNEVLQLETKINHERTH